MQHLVKFAEQQKSGGQVSGNSTVEAEGEHTSPVLVKDTSVVSPDGINTGIDSSPGQFDKSKYKTAFDGPTP